MQTDVIYTSHDLHSKLGPQYSSVLLLLALSGLLFHSFPKQYGRVRAWVLVIDFDSYPNFSTFYLGDLEEIFNIFDPQFPYM